MKFLLTNDDGVRAPGIWAAARTLAEYGSVLIVAPADNYSGYGTALPEVASLDYFTLNDDDHRIANVTAFGVTATPATCARIGLSGVLGGEPFDMVVSGINAGANMGHDVFYSGTVGAAVTAQLLGLPALAVSLDCDGEQVAHWDSAQWAIREVLDIWLNQCEAAQLIYNINVPNREVANLSGLSITSFGTHTFLTKTHFEPDPTGSRLLVAANGALSPVPEMGTDDWAVAQGYVSVTPMRPLPDMLCVTPWPLTLPRQVAVDDSVAQHRH